MGLQFPKTYSATQTQLLQNGLKGRQLMIYIFESWEGGAVADSASRAQQDGFDSVRTLSYKTSGTRSVSETLGSDTFESNTLVNVTSQYHA